ncbi:MAG: hypothetical protein M0P50_14070, partial [Bacteroidales bacterium]|nr:hypothetical protein [Bacteroidales bacterium]
TAEDAGKTQSAKRKISVFFSVYSVVFVFDFDRQEINRRGRGEDAEEAEENYRFLLCFLCGFCI